MKNLIQKKSILLKIKKATESRILESSVKIK